MDVTETDLPGVGKRFEVDIGEGETAVVLVHNTGRRELFVRPDPDADAEKVLDVSNREARVIGSVLEGAYFQPVATDLTETAIGDDLLLEWYTLAPDAELVGSSLAEAGVRESTGTTVAAVERDGEVIQSPDPDLRFEAGDKLVVVGTPESLGPFEDLTG